MGRHFKGVYHLYNDVIHLYTQGQGSRIPDDKRIEGLDNPEVDAVLGEEQAEELRMEVELVRGASHPFDLEAYRRGELTPVYFGTAMGNFGVREMLDGFVEYAPSPQSRETDTRTVEADDPRFTGFVFKIQANMDPNHRDRIAFLRVCSGKYEKNMKMRHVRIGRTSRSPTPSPSWPRTAPRWRRPGPATSSACTTTAPSRSATPSRWARTCASPASRTSPRSSSSACASRTR